MLLLAALLSLLIGAILGLLGGGGSILTVPMLVYLLGMDGKEGIASSLFVVGATSLVGVATHAALGNVRWRIGLLFGVVGMASAFCAGNLARWVPERVLLLGFAGVMIATALAMIRVRRGGGEAPASLSLARIGLLGSAVGMISGLVGAGGGFLVVPALSLLGGLQMAEAIGTSLFVIALQAFAGFGGHATYVQLDWNLLAIITTASVLGSVAGAAMGRHVPQDLLRRGFAFFVWVMGIFILSQELPGELLEQPAAQVGGAVVLVATVGAVWRNLRVTKAPPPKGVEAGDPTGSDGI
jgi:uncharacterized membrane protein YfcA